MGLKIKGNGKLIAIWLVVTLVLVFIGGSVTGVLAPGRWPGYVVSGVSIACVLWLLMKLSSTSKNHDRNTGSSIDSESK